MILAEIYRTSQAYVLLSRLSRDIRNWDMAASGIWSLSLPGKLFKGLLGVSYSSFLLNRLCSLPLKAAIKSIVFYEQSRIIHDFSKTLVFFYEISRECFLARKAVVAAKLISMPWMLQDLGLLMAVAVISNTFVTIAMHRYPTAWGYAARFCFFLLSFRLYTRR